MKLVHIVGNRPQFIKLALLHQSLERLTGSGGLIIHTGQHYSKDMSDIFFEQLRIPFPTHQLGIRDLPHNSMIGNMMIGLDPLLAAEKPDGVIVYGDTNTTLAGALAAKKRDIPLAHIEAGIRTGREDMPEESNRYVSDRLAALNFACTRLGVDNLLQEGFREAPAPDPLPPYTGIPNPGLPNHTGLPNRSPGQVYLTGDLMLDAARLCKDQATHQSSVLREHSLEGRPFILATIHRAENTGDPATLRAILQALDRLHTEIPVLFPLHPRTRQIMDGLDLPVRVIMTPPVGYLDMLALVQSCQYVITDSGGLSREAYFFEKPSLVIMNNPFWPEIFEAGPSLQTKADMKEILQRFGELANSGRSFRAGIFGDGQAASRISSILSAAF